MEYSSVENITYKLFRLSFQLSMEIVQFILKTYFKKKQCGIYNSIVYVIQEEKRYPKEMQGLVDMHLKYVSYVSSQYHAIDLWHRKTELGHNSSFILISTLVQQYL